MRERGRDTRTTGTIFHFAGAAEATYTMRLSRGRWPRAEAAAKKRGARGKRRRWRGENVRNLAQKSITSEREREIH